MKSATVFLQLKRVLTTYYIGQIVVCVIWINSITFNAAPVHISEHAKQGSSL